MGLNTSALARLRERLANPGGRDEQTLLESVLRMAAMWRSLLLANSLLHLHGNKVLNGPFAGMEYLDKATEGALLPRLIGCYESELHPYLQAIAARGLDQVVDVGCAEGYYAVGLARLMPEVMVHAFDTDPAARRFCAALAERNGVAERVKVGGAFAGEDFARFTGPRTLVFMDIEGGEAALLDPELWPALKTVQIVVETHPGPSFALTAELTRRFQPSHTVVRIDQGPKTTPLPPFIQALSHIDQLLAVWEWRRFPTPWLVMQPKG